MTPKMHPLTTRVALLLAAIDYVADKLSPIPPATHLYINSLWTYGRKPPLEIDTDYDEDEVLRLGWAEALYTPGMQYILGQMRLDGQEETKLQWFHDALYIASLNCFNLFVLSEEKHLPKFLQSQCFSDVYEINILEDKLTDFCHACGLALGKDQTFLNHFVDARLRFERELSSEEVSIWPPFNGVTRDSAQEWFL